MLSRSLVQHCQAVSFFYGTVEGCVLHFQRRQDVLPEKIAEAFIKGAEKAGKILNKNLFKELDRKKAIALALKTAKKGDVVLILGKGHEKSILRADGPHPFEDLKVTRELLRSL